MPRSDGTVLIDTKIDMSGLNRGTVDIKNQFDRMSNSAKITAETINGAFSKPLENAKLKVESLERELEGIQAKFKEAVSEDDDVAAARLGAQQERLYDRLEDARRKLEMEVRAAAARQAEAEEKAAQKTEAANRKAAESARAISKETKTGANNMSGMEKSARKFKSRMREIVTGAFFFNIISSALTRLTQTLWGAISSTDQMKSALSNLQGAAYTAASPLLNVLANAFTVLANAIATALSYLSQLYSLLSGKSLSALTQTAEQMGNVANAAGAAGGAADKAKKSLAGFDEITTLAPKDSGGGGGGGVSTPNYDYSLDSGINPQIQALADKIKELIKPLQDIDFSKARKSLKKLGDAFSGLGKTIGKGLEWAWFNILVPLAEWAIEDAAPALIDLLAGAFDFLNEVIEAFAPIAEAFWDNFLAPLAEWTGDAAVDAIEWVAEGFQAAADAIEQNSDNLADNIIEDFNRAAEQGDANFIQPTRDDFADAAEYLSGKFKEASDDIIFNFDYAAQQNDANFIQPTRKDFENAASWISEKFVEARKSVNEAWHGLATWFNTNVKTPVKNKADEIGAAISKAFSTAWTSVSTAWKGASSWFEKNVVTPIKTAFSTVWDAITGIFNGDISFNNLAISGAEYFKKLANGLIGAINRVLINANSYLNQAIGKLKNTSMFGLKPFVNLQYQTAPQIPYLAKGAVIPPNAPFAAVLGDQKSGVNVEAPLSTIQEALAIELANQVGGMMAGFEAVIARQDRILSAIEGIEIGDSIIGEAVERYNRTMAVVRGG